MTIPEFEEGDQLTIRGTEYEVDIVDKLPDKDEIIQYGLTTDEDHAVRLEPAGDSFVFVEYNEVDPDDIEIGETA